jgi:hypothetical protein
MRNATLGSFSIFLASACFLAQPAHAFDLNSIDVRSAPLVELIGWGDKGYGDSGNSGSGYGGGQDNDSGGWSGGNQKQQKDYGGDDNDYKPKKKKKDYGGDDNDTYKNKSSGDCYGKYKHRKGCGDNGSAGTNSTGNTGNTDKGNGNPGKNDDTGVNTSSNRVDCLSDCQSSCFKQDKAGTADFSQCMNACTPRCN